MSDTQNKNAASSDVRAALDAVLPHLEVAEVPGTEGAVVSVPSGRSLVDLHEKLDRYLPRPRRASGTTRLSSVASFVEFVNRHKTADTVVYVDDLDAKNPSMTCVFDAHPATGVGDGERTAQLAAWQGLRAEYAFPLSEEFRKWAGLPPAFKQGDFAEFIEDRIGDVLDPSLAGEGVARFAKELGTSLASPARLLELSRGLKVTVDARVSTKVNLQTGEGALIVSEEHRDELGAELKLPGAFAIGIPVFHLGAVYCLAVRLRYRTSGGAVTWSLVPHRLDKALHNAISEAADKVADGTGVSVFRGTAPRA